MLHRGGNMWGVESGLGLSMPSVAVKYPNKILIRGFYHTTRRTFLARATCTWSQTEPRTAHGVPHVPASLSSRRRRCARQRLRISFCPTLPPPLSPSLVLRGSAIGVIGALKTPQPQPPSPPPSPPPLLSPSVCCAGTRRQMHHCAVGTRRITACDGRTDGTVLERRSSSCLKRFGRHCHV